MIQFNIKRFAKLVRWTLKNDRGYFLKSFFQVFVVLVLLFLAFTTHIFRIYMNGTAQIYAPCAVISILMFMIAVVMGPSMMFYSMKGKNDDQMLLMIPASNFEKYLMRYSYWIILLLINIAAFIAADLIQYLLNVLMGHDYVMSVATRMSEIVTTRAQQRGYLSKGSINILFVTLLWLHSVFAVGGTFFRSHKFAWIFTTLVFIVYALIDAWLIPDFGGDTDSDDITTWALLMDGVYILWTMFNFWLSYKLFCRTQLIGKFVNL